MNNLGEIVLFSSRPASQGDVVVGMANRDKGGPVIRCMNNEKAIPAFQRFIDLNNCSHQ